MAKLMKRSVTTPTSPVLGKACRPRSERSERSADKIKQEQQTSTWEPKEPRV